MELTEKDLEEFKLNNPNMMTPGELDVYNNSKTKTTINLFGDKEIIGEVVLLITYIRHALANNVNCKIELTIGNTIANPDFMMDVNGFLVPDYTTETKYLIN